MKKLFYRLIYPLYIPIWILVLMLSTVIIGPIIIIILFIPHLDRGARFTYRYLALLWARINLTLSGVRVRVIGKEKVDRNKSYIVMANHQSNFDVLALATRLPAPASLGGQAGATQGPDFWIRNQENGDDHNRPKGPRQGT